MSLFTKLLKNSVSDFLKKRKKLIIAFAIFCSFLIGLNIVLNNYVDKVLGTLMRDFVHNQSDGFYHVDFDDIAFILNDRRFSLRNFQFKVNPDLPQNIVYENLDKNYIYQATIPELRIDIRDFYSIFIQRKLKVLGIEIIDPYIEIINLNKDKKPKKISFEAGNLYEALSKYLHELKINDFKISNGEFDYQTYQGADYDNFKIKEVTFEVLNFQVNEHSSSRKDKFFYTDDISLTVKNQLFYLKDSIHQVSFDEFYISTKQNELLFKNFVLTRREDPLKNKKSNNHYEVSLPELKLSGIDFIKAYHNNMLLIDSINIADPTINLTKRTDGDLPDSTKNNLLDIAMIYHEYLMVSHFNLSNANLIFIDETKIHPELYNINHISAHVTKVEIDTGSHSKNKYGFDFATADLIVKDYEMTMPDSLNTVKFSEFSISSNPFLIQMRNLQLRPGGNQNKASGRSEIYADIPYIVLSEFDIAKAVNTDTFMLKELYLENPQIRIISNKNAKTANQKLKPAGLFGIYNHIRSVSEFFFLQKLNISNGQFSISGQGAEPQTDIAIRDIDLNLENILVDDLIDTVNSIFGHADLDLNLSDTKIDIPSASVNLGNFHFNTLSGRLKINGITLKQDTLSKKHHLQVQLPELLITGIDANQIYSDSTFTLDTVKLSNTVFSFQTNKKIQDHTQVALPKLPFISVNHFILVDQKLDYKADGLPVMIAEDIDFDMSGLIVDQSISENAINQFDYDRVNLISVKDYSFFISNIQHLLEIHNIRWEDRRETFSMEKIHLSPIGRPENIYSLNIPKISLTGTDLKQVLKNSYYTGENIEIESPKIILKLAESDKKKNFDPDLGFIPILMRNNFYGLKTDSFKVNNAYVKISQKSKSDTIVFEADRLDILADHVEVDSATVIVPERFLFSDQLVLDGDYLSFHHQGNNDFHNINHFNIDTKKGEISLSGIHLGTNTDNKNPYRDQLRFTVEDLTVQNLNFYNYTQNKIFDPDEIHISKADFFISKGMVKDTAVVKEKPKFKLSENEYFFDTAVLKSFDIKRFLITDTKINFENDNKDQGGFMIPDVMVLAEGIHYDPIAAKDPNRIFYSDNFAVKISNISYLLPDKLSMAKVGELEINSKDSTIILSNLELKPLVSRYDYAPAKGYQSTWMQMVNEKIIFNKVDLLKIMNNKEFTAQSLYIYKPTFSIFRDMRVPFPEWQRRPLPQTELRDLKFILSIDTIKMINGYIAYVEHPEKSYSTGEVFFSDLNAKIVNLTNDSIRMTVHPDARIQASTKVFDLGRIKAEFSFDLKNPENIHSYGIEVDSLDLTEFNRIMIPSAGVEIKSGDNKKIVMSAIANEKYSHGDMKFYYDDLKIALLNRETETPKGFLNALGTFFANTFIIKSNNPRNFFLRKGEVFYERDEKRAIFNYWTKTFLSGVISSLGATNNKKKMKKMEEESLKKIRESNAKVKKE